MMVIVVVIVACLYGGVATEVRKCISVGPTAPNGRAGRSTDEVQRSCIWYVELSKE